MHVVHGMLLHHRTAHELQLLLVVVLMLMMLLQRMLVQRMRVLLLRHLLRPSERIAPRTLRSIRLESLVLHSPTARHSGGTITTRGHARLQVPSLRAEASQDAGTQSWWILQAATVARLAIPHITGLLQDHMAIVWGAVVHLQHRGEGVRPHKVDYGDQNTRNEAENA